VDERAVQIEVLENSTADLRNEVEAKSGELETLREELEARNQALAKLEVRFQASQAECESAQERIAVLKDPEELDEARNTVDKLAADLARESVAREGAENELAKATVTIDELKELREGLETRVDALNADLQAGLRVADERAAEIEALYERNTTLHDEMGGESVELDSLRQELESRNQYVAGLESLLEETRRDSENKQKLIAVLKSPKELEDAKNTADQLAADLARESERREVAESKLTRANETIEDLGRQRQELHVAVRELNADLRSASERAVDIYALELSVSDLRDKVEKRTRELESRNKSLTELETRLAASQKECELLRGRAPAVSLDEVSGSIEAQTASERNNRVQSSGVAAKFEQSIRNVPAYQSLQKYDPGFYDGLITKYKKLAGQDTTEKQIIDALRAEQAKLMERLLPQAADNAILSYARLIVDELDEFQLDGIEPCLTLLVPPSGPETDSSPIYSESTKERELNVLDVTLRTYKANRVIPVEADVWPDLEPIFIELFQAFGADNVAAMQNTYDPSVDRILVCNVTRALYSGILNLPKADAANALRWLLST
ncbi:MAG: hypothetical protein KJN77_07735, partial [Gammaproteobacteria bacterium]|nr:hypothetical protein [Gammaproteobacteria bacterium]